MRRLLILPILTLFAGCQAYGTGVWSRSRSAARAKSNCKCYSRLRKYFVSAEINATGGSSLLRAGLASHGLYYFGQGFNTHFAYSGERMIQNVN